MNDKRELNDILIGGDDVRAKDNKKLIVLIIGIVVLALAITIIVVAMTNTKNNETIVVDTATTKADANLPQNDFTNIKVDNSDDDRFEQIVRDMKNNAGTSDTNTQPPVITQPAQPVIKQEPSKITMPNKPARTATATTSKPIITSIPRRNTLNNGDIAESGYYLQVGAFSKAPNKDFISSINKYSYRIQEIMINSNVITRYLVGPYSSREDAQKDFDRVNRDIARPVFLQVQ